MIRSVVFIGGNVFSPARNVPKRNLAVDAVKAICIILVVIGHIIVDVYPETYSINTVFKICYSFHMPLFVFVGGGVNAYKSVEKISQRQWIVTRFKRLMIPYIIWSIIVETLAGEYDILRYLFVYPAYWYLINLFLCDVILFLSVQAKKYTFAVMGVLYFVVVAARVFFDDSNLVIRNLFDRFPFYAAGYICFRYKDSIILTKIKKYGWIALILYPASMILYSYGEYALWSERVLGIFHMGSFGKAIHAGLLYNQYIVASLGICFVWYVVEKLVSADRSRPAVNIFAYVGKYTMYIYILDWVLKFILPHSLFRPSLPNEFAVFAIIMLVSLTVAEVMSHAPKISKVLFGQ